MNKSSKNKKGFTIVEMLVVMGIFSILTAVTVWNYGKFNNSIILTNMAYEIALEIREAQVFSLGVRGANSGGGIYNDFDTRYGVLFEEGEKNFIFFTDLNNNGKCDIDPDDANSDDCLITECTSESECQSIKTLTRGTIVSRICASEFGDPMNLSDSDDPDFSQCSDTATAEEKDSVAITFSRPNPDAFIYDIGESDPDTYKNASILIESNDSSRRAIDIRENGQISVKFVNN